MQRGMHGKSATMQWKRDMPRRVRLWQHVIQCEFPAQPGNARSGGKARTEVTWMPAAFSNTPMDEMVMPFPRPEITPPVTSRYLVIAGVSCLMGTFLLAVWLQPVSSSQRRGGNSPPADP